MAERWGDLSAYVAQGHQKSWRVYAGILSALPVNGPHYLQFSRRARVFFQWIVLTMTVNKNCSFKRPNKIRTRHACVVLKSLDCAGTIECQGQNI